MGQIVKRKKKGRTSKADLARQAVVRRGHRRQIWCVEPCGSRRGEPSPSLYVSSLFAWVVVVNGDLQLAICGVWVVVVNGGGSRSWVDVACFFLVVASLTAAISSEIKVMAVAVAVEDGSGAGTTTCCGAPCAIVYFVFGLNGTVGCECCLNQSRKLLFFCVALVVFVVLLQRK
uniref:Transmembrane protein n=1 Tax=Fagus sylvatica TaxID=28930 RepID=A0A2N9FCU6_FAGSY